VQALANQLQRDGAGLEDLAQRFERQELDKAGPRTNAVVEVMLTDEQRTRVRAKTGIDLASVLIPDETGTVTSNMRHADPARIEWLATKEATNRRAAAEAHTQTREKVAQVLEELSSKGGRSARE